jgi:hypothetical protein
MSTIDQSSNFTFGGRELCANFGDGCFGQAATFDCCVLTSIPSLNATLAMSFGN